MNVLEAGISVTLIPAGLLGPVAHFLLQLWQEALPPSKARALHWAGICPLRVPLHPLLPALRHGNHDLPWAPRVALSLWLSGSPHSVCPHHAVGTGPVR